MITLPHYKGKKIGVFGLGKAGEATVAALRASGAEVFAWDDKGVVSEELRVKSEAHHSSLITRHFSEWPWSELECLVLAPGVPLTHPEPHAVVKMAQTNGCKIVGDIELLYQACSDATFIGITGTNGKSTTTTLIAHILKAAGKKIQVGGNLGTPVLVFEKLQKDGIYVIETSSYQLDLMQSTRFNVAVWLNITPDHIDRHGTLEGYVNAKENIFARQQESDVAIIGIDDAHSREVAEKIVGLDTQKVVTVSVAVSEKNEADVTVQGGILFAEGKQFDLSDIARLPGAHNWQNAAMAYSACRAVGVSSDAIYATMKTFPGLAHRMELLGEINGVRFVNDSKATNADATARALAPYENIYWILGGKAKEGGIENLHEFFPHVAHAFLIGDAADAFAKTLDGKVPYTQCGTLEIATNKAAAMAFDSPLPNPPPAGGEREYKAVVLLSPACASFDQFKNFEERGDAFRDYVSALNPSQKAQKNAS